MAVLAVISTPNADDAPDSAPRRIVAERPSAEIEVIHFERTDTATVPYFWMRGVPPAEFESAFRDDPTISDVRQLERTDRGAFYKATWEVDSPLIRCVAGGRGHVVHARGTAEEWHLKVWFEERSDASEFQTCCADRNVPLHVDRLTSLADALSDADAILSPPQREAMVLAYREGYFDEPRRVT
ncbi:MAG: bacterio-opsin activator domain-containing protein [Haloferacaceae archaeon]